MGALLKIFVFSPVQFSPSYITMDLYSLFGTIFSQDEDLTDLTDSVPTDHVDNVHPAGCTIL